MHLSKTTQAVLITAVVVLVFSNRIKALPVINKLPSL